MTTDSSISSVTEALRRRFIVGRMVGLAFSRASLAVSSDAGGYPPARARLELALRAQRAPSYRAKGQAVEKNGPSRT